MTDSHWCKRQQPKVSANSSKRVSFDLSNPTVWNNDSGASHNITPHGNKAGISSYSSSSTEIQIADGSVIHSTGIGKHISLPKINNVLLCSKISHNLLSTGAMADNGIHSLFTKDSVLQGDFSKLIPEAINSSILIGKRINGSYLTKIPQANMSLAEAHVKLGHVNNQAIKNMVKHDSTSNLKVTNMEQFNCQSCDSGKAKHGTGTLGSSSIPVTAPGQLIHIDLVGKITPTSHRGYKYSLCITDDFSRFDSIYLLPNRTKHH